MKTLPMWPLPPTPAPQRSRCLRLLFPRHAPCTAVLFTTLIATSAITFADPPEQSQIDFTRGVQGTFNADWEGLPGHTYFMQFSMDLRNWYYAPFIHFGDGGHHRGIHSDTDKMFLRLAHGSFPGINSLDDAMNADFSGDGLSNIFKVTHGYDPFETESTEEGPDVVLDPDGDRLSNASEQALGRDPMRMDHPAVQLEVIAD